MLLRRLTPNSGLLVKNMSMSVSRLLCAAVLCAVAGSLATAGSALADGTAPAYPGSVLHVSVSGPLTAGQVLTITGSGTNAVADPSLDVPLSYGLDVFVVNAAKLGSCDQSESAELNDVTNTNAGRLLTFESLNEGPSGPFSIPVKFTPGGPGQLLVCAYSVYVTDDAAWASAEARISPAHSKPANRRLPRVAIAHGKLGCSRGSWSGSPTSFSYRWLVAGKPSRLARRARVSLPGHLRGRRVQCAVTASNSTGRATATSRPLTVH